MRTILILATIGTLTLAAARPGRHSAQRDEARRRHPSAR